MCTRNQAEEILHSVYHACSPIFGRIHDAYLYGSYARGDFNPESDIDILLDCTSGQGVNYCELTEKFSKLTIPIKQEVESEGEIYECVSSYSLFGVVYHLEGTYSLTAELNPVPKEIFMSFYK